MADMLVPGTDPPVADEDVDQAITNDDDASTVIARSKNLDSAADDPVDDKTVAGQQEQQVSTVDEANQLQYPTVDVVMEATTDIMSNARDLSAADWRTVMETNQLLHGFHIREVNQDIVRARQNAFVLKDSEDRADVKPYFQVEDGSSIQVHETKNAFQRSLAQNSFSKRCIESNLSAGAFGVMVGITGQREREKMTTVTSEKVVRDQEYYAAFNFPRARLLLDEEELQLSPKCEAALVQVQKEQTPQSIEHFHKLFGGQCHVFVTSVLLGGQQKTSKFAAAMNIRDEDIQQDALRNAMGAKINAEYVAASVQHSKAKGVSENQSDQRYTNLSYLGMSASGGDTLFGSDIPKWAQTVAPFKNWRIVENEIAEPIHELIGKLPGWNHIPRLFKAIRGERPSDVLRSSSRVKFLMNGRPLCWFWKDNVYGLRVSDPQDANVATFRFSPAEVDGIPHEGGLDSMITRPLPPDTNSSGTYVQYERPYVLRDAHSEFKYWNVSPQTEPRWGKLAYVLPPGIPHRFSIRRAGSYGQWSPSSKFISTGDRINLYCHSFGLGPYRNLDSPPCHASPAICTPDGQEMVFAIPKEDLAGETEKIASYEDGSMALSDRRAFEKMGMISYDRFQLGADVVMTRTSDHGLTSMSSDERKDATKKKSAGIFLLRSSFDHSDVKTEPLKSADLNWTRGQIQMAASAIPQLRLDQPASDRRDWKVIGGGPSSTRVGALKLPIRLLPVLKIGFSTDPTQSLPDEYNREKVSIPEPVELTIVFEH